jgi:glyceraldehyde 3-phosphate dehydrogenase
VIESTGVFENYLDSKNHITAGAKKVLITAPGKGNEGIDGRTILIGINDSEINNFQIVSNGSCTTNAISPVIEILNKEIGIEKAILNTIHAYTNTQTIVDTAMKGDYLRGRAGAQNMIPSTTGAAKTLTKVIKELDNKFDGLAIRVPVACGSLADITFISKKPTSVEEINQILISNSQKPEWNKILGISSEPLVSSDIVRTSLPAIVDISFTKVVDGNLVKVLV